MNIHDKMITIGGRAIGANGSRSGITGKVDAFTGYIAKSRIQSPTKKIPKPDGANYMRIKSGEVLFFTTISGINDHFVPIPGYASGVYFPNYREHGTRHIIYGEPKFYQS